MTDPNCKDDEDFHSALGDACTAYGVGSLLHQFCARDNAVQPCPRSCGVCGNEGIEFFESRGPTPSSDRVCSPVTPACPPDAFQTRAPTPSSDRACQVSTACVDGRQFESRELLPYSDRECQELTLCAEYEFIATPATGSSDRNCHEYTVCDVYIACGLDEEDGSADDYGDYSESSEEGGEGDDDCAILAFLGQFEYEIVEPTSVSRTLR